MTWTLGRIVALFLGMWIAVAPAIAVAPTAAMAASMSMSGSGGTGCDDCPDKGMPGNDCMQFCVNGPFVGISPGNGSPLIAVTGGDPQPWPHQTLSGQFPVPDPGPPRSTSLR